MGNDHIYEKQARQFAKKMGYDGVYFMTEWNGYEAYEPYIKGEDILYDGLCAIIISNDKETRFVNVEESVAVREATPESYG